MDQLNLKRITKLGEMYSRTLFVIPSGESRSRSHSVNFRFKTHAEFYYLFGVHIENATALILGKKVYLCVEEGTSDWDDNNQLGMDLKHSGINVVSVSKKNEIMADLIIEADRIATAFGVNSANDELITGFINFKFSRKRRMATPLNLCDSRNLTGLLRLYKSQDEIELLRTACLKSSEVHNALMSKKLIGLTEKQVANWIEKEFLNRDMQWCSYETIVGSGERSTLLHARASDKIITEDEMIVIDAGGEWSSYCADITRSIPSGLKMTNKQKLVYESVLEVQKRILKNTTAGTSLKEIDELTKKNLQEELLKRAVTNITGENINSLMPHSTSHWIGLDVHDPSPYYYDDGSAIKLENGMSFTVEPGLYFKNKNLIVPELNAIGVRIEDDVVVENNKLTVLTSVIKEVEEIEQQRSLQH